ncbi:MAG: nitrilase-related carbon-nitrogen hydrolase, partial [Bythopirellula sp.]
MTKLRLAAAGVNQTPLAWESNRQNLLTAINAAREANATVLCLPELCLTGYGCEDAFFANGVQQTALQILLEIVPETTGIITTFGLPLLWEDQLFNVMAVCCDGVLAGFVGKQNLAGDGIHYEPRWFKPWPRDEVREVVVDGNRVPCGDLLFDCGGVKIGLEICRDAWVADRPGSRLAARGADIILNPSASHFAFAKQEIRREFVLRGSRDYAVSYAYSNLLGNESGRAIFDGGTLIATRGDMVAVGPRLSFADWVLATADIDTKATRLDRNWSTAAATQSGEPGGATIGCDFSFPQLSSAREPTKAASWDTSPPAKAEEFAHAVPLALFDYLRKSHAGGLVVSLSGGADSAAVATMIWLMVELGVADIGRAAFLQKLSHIPEIDDVETNADIVRRLLTCVYQATRNSGEVTRNAASAVADAIGAEFLEWNIDTLVDGYVDTVSQAVKRPLTWEQDDVALQN